jgi:hypothetical protein
MTNNNVSLILSYITLFTSCIILSGNVVAKPSNSNGSKIADGKYLINQPTETWIVVKGNTWYIADLDGDSSPRRISELKSIKYGVIRKDKTYYCLFTLLKNKNQHFKCTSKGWVRE